jgi:2-iminoacetate synthase
MSAELSAASLQEESTWERLQEMVYAPTPADVEQALSADALGLRELGALLSPQAQPALEQLAVRANAITLRRFGRVIVLYVPLYLSNECTNSCTYCGFAREQSIGRHTLDPAELRTEIDRLKEQQFDHVLLLTGEDRLAAPPEYVRDAVAYCHERFSSVGVEIYPMSTDEYQSLVAAGCDSLTLYQETYHQPTYGRVHPRGPKQDFGFRLEAPTRAAAAGMRSVGIGALLGLADWRLEGLFLWLHGRALRREHWRTRLAIGFPRLRNEPGAGVPLQPLQERELAQLVCALRIALPDADLVLSTRERPAFRDGMVGLGITRMSAGSKTCPGGYTELVHAGEQFAVTDDRPPAEVVAMIERKGFEPVWKDWDAQFLR